MRDDFYRKNCCYNPKQYDAVIELIKDNNIAALASGDPEEFASNVVNDCIRGVCFGDSGSFCGTGCALAVLVPRTEPKKVILAFEPL